MSHAHVVCMFVQVCLSFELDALSACLPESLGVVCTAF